MPARTAHLRAHDERRAGPRGFVPTPTPQSKNGARTVVEIIPEAHADLALGVRGDGEARLAVDPLLMQINVLLRARVHDLDVDALAGAGADVRGDDDERVGVRGVPDALGGRVAVRLEGELDGVRLGGEEEEGEEEEGG